MMITDRHTAGSYAIRDNQGVRPTAENVRSILTIVFLALISLFIFACGGPRGEKSEDRPPSDAYPPGDPSKILFVFVHGWGGDERDTWGNFRDFLEKDARLKDYKTISYGYPTSLLGHSPAIEHITNNLEQTLRNCCSQFKEYIFVTHSMGGIVAKEYILEFLRRGQASELKVNRIFLIATPNTGLDLANWASHVPGISSAQLREIKGVDSPFLERQLRQWQAHVEGADPRLHPSQKKWIRTVPIYGTDDRVVDISSARDRFPLAVSATGRGHVNIVKPERSDDFVVQTVIEQALAPLRPTHTMTPRDLTPPEEQSFERAREFVRRREYWRALSEIQPVTEKYAEAHFLRHMYGTILSYIPGRQQDAIRELSRAKDLKPDHVPTRFNLALALHDVNRLKAAAVEAAWVYENDPTHTKARFLLAYIAFQEKRYADAKKYYSEIVNAGRDGVPHALLYLAHMELLEAKTEEARDRALRLVRRALDKAQEEGPRQLEELVLKICRDVVETSDALHVLLRTPDFQKLLGEHRRLVSGRPCLL